eukprot:3292561-Rhodomonas_salina.1
MCIRDRLETARSTLRLRLRASAPLELPSILAPPLHLTPLDPRSDSDSEPQPPSAEARLVPRRRQNSEFA